MRPQEVHRLVYRNRVVRTLTSEKTWENVGMVVLLLVVGLLTLGAFLLVTMGPWFQYWSDRYGSKGPAYAHAHDSYAVRYWWTVGDIVVGSVASLIGISKWMKQAERWPWEPVVERVRKAVNS